MAIWWPLEFGRCSRGLPERTSMTAALQSPRPSRTIRKRGKIQSIFGGWRALTDIFRVKTAAGLEHCAKSNINKRNRTTDGPKALPSGSCRA
jgi:hypothetical protein